MPSACSSTAARHRGVPRHPRFESYLERENLDSPEFLALLLFATAVWAFSLCAGTPHRFIGLE